ALAFRHVVPSDGRLIIENESWGNQAAPQLHCLEGLAASGDAVTIAGDHTGAGILVVRNADLILAEAFRWEGLVIVTGNDVGLKTMGSGTKDVLGASIVNETGN